MVARGKFFLYDSIVPALEAGDYTMTARVGLDTTGDGVEEGDLPTAPLATHINVTAPRFKLPPDQALMTFPPANSEGAYEARLPQIVLKKRTLPWDRKAAPTGTVIKTQTVEERTPWLALIVIAEGEGQVVHDKPWEECITNGVLLTGRVDTPRASYLSVPQSTVDAIFPTIEDLAMLTHVREVNLDDTEAAMGDDDGFLAVVVANRMPQFDSVNCKPKAYTACLVNLEGQLDALPVKSPPRTFFHVSDVFLNDTVASIAGAAISGAAVPLITHGEPRTLDASNRDAMLDAVRRGEVVFHEGALMDRAAIGADGGANRLGTISAEDFLDGNFSTLASGAAVSQSMRVAGTFRAFEFPLELVTFERFFRFPVLTSWRFTCAGDGSFEQLMRNLDVGLLGTKAEGGYKRPLADCVPQASGADPGAAPVTKLPLEIAETGHVGLPHLTRTGARENSWYRGPLSPHQLLRDPLASDAPFPVLAHVSDHLRMMTPDGREDVSLAVAFETGRLMAMSQPSFVAALMRWRDEAFGAARARQGQKLAIADRLRLLDRFVDAAILEKFDTALALGNLGRALEGSLLGVIESHRLRTVGNPRPPVDAALEIPELRGDVTRFTAEGLGLGADIMALIAKAPEDPRVMTMLQSTQPGLVADTRLELDTKVTASIEATLETGLGVLASVAVGAEKFDLQTVERLKEMESLGEFEADRFGRDR
ncbi:hypothetical protein GVY41_01290 [Frigidibacter albus]|uniref:Uncharacterized protein n=1 Tax=Frigidibacter albus TaxID=1465486 RepID=A0A6L8VBL7_9RHOB|nr:hypothetical protein [Frigidibacter albus]MZQ87727.1 hypothetical protein [Frigidibacter albus]NBE29633.1 hypothetical protein [Frigidibacter albus]GGH43667.1 hypothetical protein GCM10011341_02500 [Frigidibacter albus]